MFQPDGNERLCPGQSLWSLITENVSQSELLEIQTALGQSLVGMYTEIHAEAEMWHKIWKKSHQCGGHSSKAETPLAHLQGSPLADPPAVKELVRAEVKMLLQTLRERVCEDGRDGEEVFVRYKPELVKYALGHQDICYTNNTTVSTEDTENASRPTSHCLVQFNAEDEIDAVKDKLNVTEIHKVVDRLRSLLLRECEALTTMINYFKMNLKKNFQSQGECDKYEPSLSELRELRGAVQMDLELYSCSSTTSSPLPVEGLKNIRLSSEQSTDTLPERHGPPRLSHLIPRPPSGPPPAHSSPSRTLHRLASVSNKAHKHPTSNCKDTSGLASSSVSTEQKTVQNIHMSNFSPEKDDTSVNCGASSSFHMNSEKDLPSPETHSSSNLCFQTPRSECDSFPQKEVKISPTSSSKNNKATPSSVPALSHLCNVGSESRNNALHHVLTERNIRTQTGPENSGSRGSLESTAVHTGNCGQMITPGSSVMTETLTQDTRGMSNSGTDRNKNCPRDGTKALSYKGQRSKGNISPVKSRGDSTDESRNVQDMQALPNILNRFYQPVPPAGAPP